MNSELATRLATQAAKAERDREDKAKLNAVRNIVNQDHLTPTPSATGTDKRVTASATKAEASQAAVISRRVRRQAHSDMVLL